MAPKAAEKAPAKKAAPPSALTEIGYLIFVADREEVSFQPRALFACRVGPGQEEEEGYFKGRDLQGLHLQGAQAGAPRHWYQLKGATQRCLFAFDFRFDPG